MVHMRAETILQFPFDKIQKKITAESECGVLYKRVFWEQNDMFSLKLFSCLIYYIEESFYLYR